MRGRYFNTEELHALGKASSLAKSRNRAQSRQEEQTGLAAVRIWSLWMSNGQLDSTGG